MSLFANILNKMPDFSKYSQPWLLRGSGTKEPCAVSALRQQGGVLKYDFTCSDKKCKEKSFSVYYKNWVILRYRMKV